MGLNVSVNVSDGEPVTCKTVNLEAVVFITFTLGSDSFQRFHVFVPFTIVKRDPCEIRR